MIDKIKSLLNLYSSFAKIGTFTIGGGLAMMPMMQAELIEKRKWITDEELIEIAENEIKKSKQLQDECQKHNIKFVDTSFNRNDILKQLLKEIINQIKD